MRLNTLTTNNKNQNRFDQFKSFANSFDHKIKILFHFILLISSRILKSGLIFLKLVYACCIWVHTPHGDQIPESIFTRVRVFKCSSVSACKMRKIECTSIFFMIKISQTQWKMLFVHIKMDCKRIMLGWCGKFYFILFFDIVRLDMVERCW